MTTALLDAVTVSKSYRRGPVEVTALRDVSFSVDAGTIVALVGPSGSGKSTLLNLIAGLDRPSAGEVRVNDTCLSELDPDSATVFRRRNIGFVFQFFNLLPTMSARRNVALPLIADRRPRHEIGERVDAALAAVRMAHRADHRPGELSGGEQQRVAIARALVMQPRLLLADEPTGNLDSETGAEMLRLLRRIVTERSLAVLMATHSGDAAAMADRVLRMSDGRVAEPSAALR
jgi:putative ABC transport system ATP-binding protein